MHVYSVPAKYEPELNRAIAAAVRMIQFDITLRDGRDAARHGGFVESEMIDNSRTGDLTIIVGNLEKAS